MHNIIYDCDNTIGLPGKDVDDGLTILYLLGRKEVNLLGLTTTHGNSTVDEVYKNTKDMFSKLNIVGVPILKGGSPSSSRISEASKFILKMVKENPGEITILATGSMTNLYGAYLEDKNFFKYVKEIVIMGGILKPLMIRGKQVEELNLSCDAEAAFYVLNSEAPTTILNGHTTLETVFGEKEMNILQINSNNKLFNYIYENIKPWYDLMYKNFGVKGFCNWDAAAAIYITNPEIFLNENKFISPTLEDLTWGYMREVEDIKNSHKVNMPSTIKDIEKFNTILLESWKNLI